MDFAVNPWSVYQFKYCGVYVDGIVQDRSDSIANALE